MCHVAQRQRTKQQNMDTSEEINRDDLSDNTSRGMLLRAVRLEFLLDTGQVLSVSSRGLRMTKGRAPD